MRIRMVLAATMLVATACGGGSQAPSDPVDALTAASERLAEGGAFDVTFESTMTGPAPQASFVVRGEGTVELGAGRGHLTIRGEASHADSLGGATCELLYDGSHVYGKVPDGISAEHAETFGFDPSAEWLRSPLGEDDELPFTSGTPNDVLDSLHRVSDDVEVVGTEDVGGVTTTHYRGTVSGDEPLDESGPSGSRAETGPFNGPGVIDAWIDDGGLLRRTTVHAESQGASLDIRMELVPHDGPVEISPPATATDVESANIVSAACFLGAAPGLVPGDPSTTSSDTSLDARSAVMMALTSAKTVYTDEESFEAAAERLSEGDWPVAFVDGESTGPRTVSVHAVSATEFRAAALSEDGTCLAARDVIGEGQTYARGTVDACTAQAFPTSAYSSVGWA